MSTEAAPTPSPELTPLTSSTSETPSLIAGTEAPAEAPKTEEVKTEAAAEFVPVTIEAIKLPDGFTADETTMKEFVELSNDMKLPAAEVQKLVDFQARITAKAETAAADANTASWNSLQEQWVNEAKKDTEIGGGNLEPVLGNIAKLTAKFGSPELNQVFNMTGAGNHPVMIKFLNKIAKELITEGGPVSGAPASNPQSLADKMYPSMKQGA